MWGQFLQLISCMSDVTSCWLAVQSSVRCKFCALGVCFQHAQQPAAATATPTTCVLGSKLYTRYTVADAGRAKAEVAGSLCMRYTALQCSCSLLFMHDAKALG
jgi:hypothetical protein